MRPNPYLLPVVAVAVTIGGIAACSHATPAPTAAPAPTPTRTAPATQTPPQTPDTTQPAPGAGRGRGPGAGNPAAGGATNPQPYNRVVTADAKTRDGMFKIHRIGDRLLFEIPRHELGKDELLVSEIAKTTLGAGYGSQPAGEHVLRWERRDNRILLRSVAYGVIASDSTNPVRGAVEAANVEPIISVFNVEAYGPDSAPVIDVSRLFTQVPAELNPSAITGQLDQTRSFLETALAFPDNINVQSTLTFSAGRGGAAAADAGGGGRGRGGPNSPSQTVVMSYSIHKLPEVPMKPRLCDNRVGYFSTSTTDYSRADQRVQTQCFITRYRLEKKDPSAALSEPVKQIVYYIDPNTPKKWVPWLKKAVEDWNPAFEAAGFKNAIVAKEAPTDGEWSAQDARYSVVDWLPSTTENASGPNVNDPRSGEIMNAHIQFYHNVQSLARTWYFTQVGHLDPRARMFPIPDSLMGRLLEYVLAHEVGHTLGFQHNMKASAQYPIDSIRNASFVHRMGHTPTLMDYSRFNYVAQPEDHIALEDLIPRIGPYDLWATHWGYAPIAAKSPEDERATLDSWAREQDQKPWLRFSTSGAAGSDPQDETEAVGDIDPVRATELGVKNLKVIMKYVEAATVKPLDDFDDLGLLYTGVISQWRTEMGHVVNLVGGSYSQEKYGGQTGPRFTPVPKARQKQAVQFLADNALKTPTYLIDTEIDRRLEPSGEVRRIQGAQAGVLTGLMNDAKLTRMIEWEAVTPGPDDYSAAEFLSDVRHAVWSELSQSAPTIDVYRRELQRSWTDQAIRRVRPPAPAAAAAPAPGGGGGGRGGAGGATNGDIKALFRGELQEAEKELTAAIPKAGDRMTRLHLETMRADIRDALAGKGTTADDGGN